MLIRTVSASIALTFLLAGCVPSEPKTPAEVSCPETATVQSVGMEAEEDIGDIAEQAAEDADESEAEDVEDETEEALMNEEMDQEADQEDDIPSLTIPMPDKAPEIDGSLDDAAWESAPEAYTYFIWGGQEKPQQKTVVRVLADSQALYVAFECRESHMEELSANVTERDGTVWEDDVVEVFLLPGQVPSSSYYHVLINAANTIADEKAKSLDAWNADNIQSAIGKYDDHWVAEIRLPWSDLGVEGDLPAEWRGNFTRTRPGKGMTYFEDQAWSPTLLDTSHVPERFGYLTIEALE